MKAHRVGLPTRIGSVTKAGPDWQDLVVRAAIGGLRIYDPNPFPVFKLWGRR